MLDNVKSAFNKLFSVAKLTHYKSLDTDIKRMTKELEALKAPMKQFLIDNNLTEEYMKPFKITLTVVPKTYFDKDTFAKDYPDLYEKYSYVKEEQRFHVG